MATKKSDLAKRIRAAKKARDDANPPAKGSSTGLYQSDPLMTEAQAAADYKYGAQDRALGQLAYNTPAWWGDYMKRSQAAQTAAQTYSAPIIADAQQLAGGIGAVGGALAPDSPEAARAAQAGGNISALAKLGAQTLQSQAAATNNYFSGAQDVAARQLPAVQAQIAQQRGQLQGEKADYALGRYSDLRAQAVNEDIARRTLGANISNQNFDNTLSAGINPLTGKPIPPDPLSPGEQKTAADLAFFEKNGYYPPTGPPKPAKTDKTGLTPAQQQAAKEKEAKRVGGVREKSGKAVARIKDAAGRWDIYKTRRVKTGKTIKVNGQDVDETRKANANDVTQWLLDAKFTTDEIRIALKVRAGKKLDGADIDTLHSMGVRIPRSWLPAPGKGVAGRPGNAPGAPGEGSRPT